MKIHGEENISFLAINQKADSMFSLIADGQHRATSLGRDMWKTLIGLQASLQINCNMEGFNARYFWSANSRARIGLVANNQDDCWSCNSRIGFPDDTNTCASTARNLDNATKTVNYKAMGYIFVR